MVCRLSYVLSTQGKIRHRSQIVWPDTVPCVVVLCILLDESTSPEQNGNLSRSFSTAVQLSYCQTANRSAGMLSSFGM